MDATELLKKDHQEVTKLFQRFHESRGGRSRGQLVGQICTELSVHAQIEEELFYPAVRQTGDAELCQKVDESIREHERMKEDIAAIEARRNSEDADLEAGVTQLQEDTEHHVTEEEGEMFPRVAAVMDEQERAELGRRLRMRKQELSGEGRPAARRGAANARKRTAAHAKQARPTERRRKTVTSRGKVKRGRKSGGTARKRARGGRGR